MADSKSEFTKRLRNRIKYGGISGGEEKSPPNYSSVQAKLSGVGVIFDADTYEYDVQTESDHSFTMHTVKAKDGREAYFEVKEGKLYAFLSFGLNVEIWQGLLVIGARSYKDDVRARKRSPRHR
ncbi:hypothetical protein IF803_39885 [Bradyrhizobium sp. UFLA06-06]